MSEQINAVLSEDDASLDKLIRELAQKIKDRKLQAPVTLFLESCSPLSGVLFHVGIAFKPLLTAVLGAKDVEAMLRVMESPKLVQELQRQLNSKA